MPDLAEQAARAWEMFALGGGVCGERALLRVLPPGWSWTRDGRAEDGPCHRELWHVHPGSKVVDSGLVPRGSRIMAGIDIQEPGGEVSTMYRLFDTKEVAQLWLEQRLDEIEEVLV